MFVSLAPRTVRAKKRLFSTQTGEEQPLVAGVIRIGIAIVLSAAGVATACQFPIPMRIIIPMFDTHLRAEAV